MLKTALLVTTLATLAFTGCDNDKDNSARTSMPMPMNLEAGDIGNAIGVESYDILADEHRSHVRALDEKGQELFEVVATVGETGSRYELNERGTEAVAMLVDGTGVTFTVGGREIGRATRDPHNVENPWQMTAEPQLDEPTRQAFTRLSTIILDEPVRGFYPAATEFTAARWDDCSYDWWNYNYGICTSAPCIFFWWALPYCPVACATTVYCNTAYY